MFMTHVTDTSNGYFKWILQMDIWVTYISNNSSYLKFHLIFPQHLTQLESIWPNLNWILWAKGSTPSSAARVMSCSIWAREHRPCHELGLGTAWALRIGISSTSSGWPMSIHVWGSLRITTSWKQWHIHCNSMVFKRWSTCKSQDTSMLPLF